RSDGVIGILKHKNVALHPRMHIALYRDGIFGAAKSFVDRSSARRLRLIPLAIVFRHGMNVVSSLVIVLDFEGLAGHQSDDVRVVHAALLIEYDGLFGRVERVVTQAVLHIDDYVGEVALVIHHDFGWNYRAGMLFLAIGLGAHVDRLGLNGLARS